MIGSDDMPCWSIHLAIAKRINKELNFNKNIFYFANIMPDTDYDSILKRYDSHYYGTLKCEGCPKEELPDLDRFLDDYKNYLKDPLICGYYCHILSDYFYNKEVYTKYFVQDSNNNIIGIKLNNGKILKLENDINGKKRDEYKHKDFENYGKILYKSNRVEFPVYDKDINNNISKLKLQFLDEQKIIKIIDNMTVRLTKWNTLSLKEKIFGIRFYMMTKKELDIMYENCIEFILSQLHKNKVI